MLDPNWDRSRDPKLRARTEGAQLMHALSEVAEALREGEIGPGYTARLRALLNTVLNVVRVVPPLLAVETTPEDKAVILGVLEGAAQVAVEIIREDPARYCEMEEL